MIPIIEKRRTTIPGGTWTPKVGGIFEEGDPKKTAYLIKGSAEIRDRGGQLKLFCKGIKIEKRSKKEPPPPPPPPPPSDEDETKAPHEETNLEHVMKLMNKINEAEQKHEEKHATVNRFIRPLKYKNVPRK